MALATHQLQGCCSCFPFVPSSWSRRSKSKRVVPLFFPVGRKDRFLSLKCRSCLSVGATLASGPRSNFFAISAFKGRDRHDGSGSRINRSKPFTNPAKFSYWQHQNKESLVESSKYQNVVPAHYPAETTTRSQAIQNLFKYWLILLRSPLQTLPVEEVVEEPSSTARTELPSKRRKRERGEVLKAIWCHFMGLDAAIKIPFLIFTPLYLTVKILYGSEVSKELTPLWFLGPIIIALYVKMFWAICGFYVFSFRQALKVAQNLPAYSLLAYEYIFRGKLIEVVRTMIWKPMADTKNLNYSEVSRRILKDLQGWLVERYLDFIESIWPYYCRTIRFLKRANLI